MHTDSASHSPTTVSGKSLPLVVLRTLHTAVAMCECTYVPVLHTALCVRLWYAFRWGVRRWVCARWVCQEMGVCQVGVSGGGCVWKRGVPSGWVSC